jgi:tagatose 1,6-diphosphate aldolase
VFIENLEFADASGTDYSGVLCGRATWLDGVKIYGAKGLPALEDWLSVEGVKNIKAVNDAVKGATPWQKKAGVAAA